MNHIELRSLRAAAVAQNDGGAENGLGHVGQKLIAHVLAEFLGARVGIVIRARPIDRGVFGYDFVFSFARNGNGGNVRIAAQAVAILRAARELNDFECASQVDVQALLFRLAVQRCGAVNEGVRGVHQRMVLVIGEAKTLAGQITAKNAHPRVKVFGEFGELKVQLQRSPKPFARFLFGFRANQEILRRSP